MTANPHEDREVAEVRQLKRTNEEITRLKEAFEQCIERTRELEAANEALRSEITDHKRIEERLRKSEKRFRSYFELGLIGMAITSPTRGILEVNDVICEILGYERSELIQMTWAEIAHPDDLAAEAAQFSRVMAGEIDGYSMDKRWIRKDGKVIYSTISVKCLRRADGSVDYFVALLQGITERKHAEKTLRESREELTRQVRFLDATLLNAGDYVYVWNREKRFVYANRVLEKLWGWTRDEWFGKTLAELGNTPELVELLERHIEQVFETKKVVTGEVAYTSPSGVFGYYDYIFSPVFGEDGSVERVAGVSRNTTERRRTEEALRESEECFRLLVER
ncbi:MAG TPA: PAS domain S-box protein, partial [Gammaproteobacteria bacterium]|nr:PAS domain S-box protein [Gammaproteobacteria bacterium]